MELITDPSLIVLDEPTSGLDSFKATGIVYTLHKLAKNRGKTIISTIHSPSSDAFAYFDKLLLLADGHIVFQGTAKRCKKYFEKLSMPLERFKNPADSMLKKLSISYPKKQEDIDKLSKFLALYKQHNEPKMLQEREEVTNTNL